MQIPRYWIPAFSNITECKLFPQSDGEKQKIFTLKLSTMFAQGMFLNSRIQYDHIA